MFSPSKYRVDIQVLRGLAVLAVIQFPRFQFVRLADLISRVLTQIKDAGDLDSPSG